MTTKQFNIKNTFLQYFFFLNKQRLELAESKEILIIFLALTCNVYAD